METGDSEGGTHADGVHVFEAAEPESEGRGYVLLIKCEVSLLVAAQLPSTFIRRDAPRLADLVAEPSLDFRIAS